jgi:LAS superfamily LD-carboxypeptidase LdcB
VAVSSAILTGRDTSELCAAPDVARLGAPVHRLVVEPFVALRDAAAAAGFDLAILSGFRSFEQQLSIWNRKATGQRAVLDSAAQPLELASLGERELVFAILRWSALPGASRHHWGTDIDVYDAAAVPPGYEVELIPAETDPGGMFGPLHAWLDHRIATRTSFGFYRPYNVDRGGVAPERWHLSYAPLASTLLRQLTPERLRAAIETADLRLKEVVLTSLDEIHERFVMNVNRAVP